MPNPTDDQIASVAIFSRLAPEDRALIAAVADLRTFSKGDVVFTEGEPANVILTILSGRIHVSSAAGRALDLPEVLDAGEVKATIVMRPKRGRKTKITVRQGDTFSGRLAAGFPIQYVKFGEAEAVIDKTLAKFGCIRVAVEVKVGGKRTYPDSVVLAAT